jgi:two-component sensor histidine kinase
MATIYPYFGCPLLYDYDLYPESVSLESYLDELISHLDSSKDLRNKDQADIITYIVSMSKLDYWSRLNTISSGCQNELPWNFEIILRYDIETVFVNYLKKELPTAILSHESDLLFGKVKSLKSILPEDLVQYCYTKIFNDLTFEAAIREDERRKVMFEISHSIKNLMASVSEPLDMLKDQLEGTQRRTVENALAGAGLIRDLAVGVHMSMRGEPGTWRKDVLEPGFGAATLDKIILDAVRHAVSNMFDGKYFAQFVKNYFGKDLNTFMQAQNEWKAAVSAEDTFACINKYFFDFKIDCGESSLNIPIGDRDGTSTKLLILFQELFLNAVKYSSFTEREKRFVKLNIAITPENWHITLSNSAAGRQNTKSSGIGLAVIKNFAALFEAKYDVSFEKETYITNIIFFLNK